VTAVSYIVISDNGRTRKLGFREAALDAVKRNFASDP